MKVYKIVPFLLVLVCAVIIFWMSSKPKEESNDMSLGVTEKIVDIAVEISGNTNLDKEQLTADFNGTIRKYAHFFLYTILGMVSMIFIPISVRGKWDIKSWLFAFLICVLYAASDEIHQLFVPGRGAQFTDVLIDSSGALLGSQLIYQASKLFTAHR